MRRENPYITSLYEIENPYVTFLYEGENPYVTFLYEGENPYVTFSISFSLGLETCPTICGVKNMNDLGKINNENVEKIVDEFSDSVADEMDLIFVLDKSGSMSGSVSSTINGYNAFIEKQMSKEYRTRVTTVLFDDGYQILHSRKSIRDVKPLTNREYYAGGCTALYDAIGRTIELFKDEISNKVLFVIITDGYENSSVRFNKRDIKGFIDDLDWEFVFIGSEIDSYSEASSIGIKDTHTANFKKSEEGFHGLFDSCSIMLDIVHDDAKIADFNWKENLEG